MKSKGKRVEGRTERFIPAGRAHTVKNEGRESVRGISATHNKKKE